MLKWFFQKWSNKNINVEESVKNSFLNVREDMAHISKWISHFKLKHDDHEQKISLLYSRLDKIEKILEQIEEDSPILEEKVRVEELKEESTPSFPASQWDELTDTQKKVCWFISKLTKESTNGWVASKVLAREMYPTKEYIKTRSTVSQFISTLEEHGFVQRRRNGKQAYVKLIEGLDKKKIKAQKPSL